MNTLRVELGSRSYDLVIGAGLLDSLGARCAALLKGRRCLVLTDENVAPLYAERAETSLEAAGIHCRRFVVPAGEKSKAVERLGGAWAACVEAGLDRRSFVLALGGGVVGDLAGFVAATYLRGIDFIQVPTSLLAMVDSAVGGKTGVNLPHGKNLVGAFHQPRLVLADLDLLKSLPPREFRAGMAEVIKYGVIWSEEMFARIEANVPALLRLDPDLLEELVTRSCAIKAEVVGDDEREEGLRAILNYGHTLGHAIENVQGYGERLHGEAIAIGMVFASTLSETLCGLPAEATARQRALFTAFDLPVDWSDYGWEAVRRAMTVDKKAQNAVPRFILAQRIGRVTLPQEVPETALRALFTRP